MRISIRQNHGTPIEFVVAKNIKRRHLTPSQRAVIALDALPLLEQAAKERRIELTSTGGWGNKKNLVENFPQGLGNPDSKSRDKAAEQFQANPRYVSDAKRIQKEASVTDNCL